MSFSKIFLSGSIHYNHPSNEIVLCLIAVDWCCMQVGRNLLWPRLCNPAHVQLGHSSATARPPLTPNFPLCTSLGRSRGWSLVRRWTRPGLQTRGYLSQVQGAIDLRSAFCILVTNHKPFLQYSDLWIYLEQYLQ